jgi:hypothetical protein
VGRSGVDLTVIMGTAVIVELEGGVGSEEVGGTMEEGVGRGVGEGRPVRSVVTKLAWTDCHRERTGTVEKTLASKTDRIQASGTAAIASHRRLGQLRSRTKKPRSAYHREDH